MFAPTKDGELPIVITQNAICANQKTECFANDSLCAHTTLDVTCFSTLVGRHFKRYVHMCLM